MQNFTTPSLFVYDINRTAQTSTNGTYLNGEKIGKFRKKMLENGASIEFLRKAKNHEDNISYRYINIREEQKEHEEGGPQSKYNLLEVLGTCVFTALLQ